MIQNEFKGEETDWSLLFFSSLLKEAGLSRNDIFKIFREYENERLLVPIGFHSFEYKKYCASLWTLHTMQNILVDAFDRNGPEALLLHGDRFCKMLDTCCTSYPVGEINTLFSVCYDVANEILLYFLV